MSTRAQINIYDENDEILVRIYKHYDGGDYLLSKLKNFLKDRILINGIPLELDDNQKYSNGIEDLAAQLIYELKKDSPVGDVYIINSDAAAIDYLYKIYPIDNKVKLVMEVY